MKNLATIVFVLITLSSNAGDPKFPVSSISEEMKKGMYAVIRLKEIRFEIKSINSSSTYYHQVVTILNPNGKDFAEEVIGYNKFTSITFLKGTVYDESGEVIKRLKQNEVQDQSSYDGFSLYTDNRLKYVDLSQNTYPYTIEFEYQIDEKYLYSPSPFYLYFDDEVSIEEAHYTVVYANGLKPRIKQFQVEQPKITQMNGGKETLTWSFRGFKPPKFESFSPDIKEIIPHVLIAPTDFEYDGYAGKMNSWENYGKWQQKLNEGRDELSESTKIKVMELTQKLKTIEEKTKILYEYLQNRTRYVNISLGIGGLQPFPAKIVDQVGYGDCKALSNYMVSLLNQAGVKGYYTKIMAGENAALIDEEFPMHQTNHIIVGVPNGTDTLWLECTSQTNPFDYQGSFTGDRKAFMVTETGGKLVNTHRYTAENNVESRIADVFVDLSGNAKAKIKSNYSGLQYENNNLSFTLDNQYDDQKKWIQKTTAIPSFDISSFKMTNIKNKIPTAIVDLDLILNRFATISGKRIFITPNLMNRSTFIPEKLEVRKTNVVRKLTYTDLDTIRYHLPEGIYPEFLPTPIKLKNRFGEYEATFQIDQDNLLYIRKVKMNKGEFPPESYNELIEFYRGINKADNTKIVFLSKT